MIMKMEIMIIMCRYSDNDLESVNNVSISDNEEESAVNVTIL
jgi:hypothetical protein